MFVIRRIHDDLLSVNQRALAAVQQMMREQFRDLPEHKIVDLPRQLREPTPKFRRVVLVAETARGVKGFATIVHAGDVRFCYLDFIAAVSQRVVVIRRQPPGRTRRPALGRPATSR